MRQARQQTVVTQEFKPKRAQNRGRPPENYREWEKRYRKLEEDCQNLFDALLAEQERRQKAEKDLAAERKKTAGLEKDLKAAEKRAAGRKKTIDARDETIKGLKNRAQELRDRCKELTLQRNEQRMALRQELQDVHQGYQAILNHTEGDISDEVRNIREENRALKKKNKDLTVRDNHNDGPNTPGSKKTLGQKIRKEKKEKGKGKGKGKGKAGAKKGHKGVSHKYDKPTVFRKVVMNRCSDPTCRSCHLVHTSTEKILTEEMTKPQKQTIENEVLYYDCLECGLQHQRADDPHLRNGRYGPRVILQVVQNYLSRMPNRLNAEQIAILVGILMSPGTVHKILKRFCGRLVAPANVIIQHLQRAKILHVDETSISLAGKNVWIWTFFDPKSGRVAFVIRPSRGADVPREILGENWKGTLIADGWRAYARYVVQRCTAHLVREIGDIADKNDDDPDAAHALAVFRRILRDAKRRIPKKLRDKQHRALTKRVNRMIGKYRHHHLLGKCMEKFERALPDMFRFVLNPAISADNNAAERLLREPVVHRKVRGSIRSEETMEWLGALYTCVGTWKSQNLDYTEELARYV